MAQTPISLSERPPIESYGDGGFRLAGGFVAGSVLLLPGQLEPWPVSSWTDLTRAHLDPLLSLSGEIDFVLLGCGADVAAAPAFLKEAFGAAGLGYDVMQTGAACRTYNVVLAEGRRMAAGLIAVS